MSRRPLVFERTRAKTYWERFRDTLGHLPGFVGAWNFLMWLSFQYEDAPAPVWTRYRDILRWIMGFLIGAPILSLVAWQLLQQKSTGAGSAISSRTSP